MRSACVLLLLVFLPNLEAETVRFNLIDRGIVLDRLHACPNKDLDREEQLQKEFADAGCQGSNLGVDQPRHSKFGNHGQKIALENL